MPQRERESSNIRKADYLLIITLMLARNCCVHICLNPMEAPVKIRGLSSLVDLVRRVHSLPSTGLVDVPWVWLELALWKHATPLLSATWPVEYQYKCACMCNTPASLQLRLAQNSTGKATRVPMFFFQNAVVLILGLLPVIIYNPICTVLMLTYAVLFATAQFFEQLVSLMRGIFMVCWK